MPRLLPLALVAMAGYALPVSSQDALPAPPAAAPAAEDAAAAEADRPAEPFQATLSMDRSLREALVELNRDGYAALFAWTAGGSAYLIHPDDRPFSRHWLEAGEHLIHTAAPRHPGMAQLAVAPRYGLAPVYFALIVADRPLSLGEVEAGGRVPGTRALLGPQATARAIIRALLPEAETAEWTAAYDAAWPEAAGGVLAWPGTLPGPLGPGCRGGVLIPLPTVGAVGAGIYGCRPPRLGPAGPIGTLGDGRTALPRPAAATPDQPERVQPATGSAPAVRPASPVPGAGKVGVRGERRPVRPSGGPPPGGDGV